MSNFNNLLLGDLELLKQIVAKSETLSQVCLEYKYSNNGRNTKEVRQTLTDNNINFSHFRLSNHSRAIEYTKVCPNCKTSFLVKNTRDGNKKVCCSYSCANKYFAWKQGGKNYIGALDDTRGYRDYLFTYLTKNNLNVECVVCKEPKVLDVHHIDEDKTNNSIDNLVVLCPTHHYAYHRYGDGNVIDKICEHIENRI